VADSEARASKIGLSLNHGKTEMLGLSTEFSSCSDSTGLGFRRIPPDEEELLGSPLCDLGVAEALNQQRAGLSRFTAQLSGLSLHEFLLVLVWAFSVPVT